MPAARRALHEALLDQIGLDDLLDGVARLAQRRGKGLDADRTAGVAFRDEREIAPVESIETAGVHFEPGQRRVGDDAVDLDAAGDGGEIAHALQQAAGDARRAARALGDLARAVVGEAQDRARGLRGRRSASAPASRRTRAGWGCRSGRATAW